MSSPDKPAGQIPTRSRRLRRLAMWWAPALVLAAVGSLFAPRVTAGATPKLAASSHPEAAGGPSTTRRQQQPLSGKVLYEDNCASCHGSTAQGEPSRASDNFRGPDLHGVGEAQVDFQLRTGRMPLKQKGPQEPPFTPYFTNSEIKAIEKYLAPFVGTGPAIPKVDPSAGNVAKGGTVFREYCAACHSWAGAGGTLTNRVIPNIHSATPQEIADAVRSGPLPMPRFGSLAVSKTDLNSVIAYVDYMKHPLNNGGDPMSLYGPVASGFAALAIGLVLLVGFIRWIGERG